MLYSFGSANHDIWHNFIKENGFIIELMNLYYKKIIMKKNCNPNLYSLIIFVRYLYNI